MYIVTNLFFSEQREADVKGVIKQSRNFPRPVLVPEKY